jgi:transcriptional regulator with XRE-family HTH domain
MTKKNPSREEMETGERIRELRSETMKLSQQAFADRLGVTRGAVGNWERGFGIKRENLRRIADEFDVSFEWLGTGKRLLSREDSVDDRLVELYRADPDEAEELREDFISSIERRLQRLHR